MSAENPISAGETFAALAGFGSATVYEAAGREGLVDLELVQVIPGSRAAGPARTAFCGQDDNLMVHAVMPEVQPGEVIVVSMPRPAPVALVGELLATQASVRNAAAILVDASVRDVEELRELGLPIWCSYVRVRGATKDTPGELNVPVTLGGARVCPGDTVVLDADGAVAVSADRTTEVLEASRSREEKEATMRKRLEAGELSYDIYGFRSETGGISR